MNQTVHYTRNDYMSMVILRACLLKLVFIDWCMLFKYHVYYMADSSLRMKRKKCTKSIWRIKVNFKMQMCS